ncbi:MarR family transcriptional regulator [Actinoplanes sp. NPDC051346]|uniref:MarR family winged helix-turn-helix transcriptional regulator n=1 Tax=Actinoplanes sp. NPDC051346 TaxID=3155048 RepID=UPI00342B91A1
MTKQSDVLRAGLSLLFRLRGVLDPTQAIPGSSASLSEAMALQELVSRTEATQSELGSHLGLEKSTISRLIDAMVGKGWVVKERDPSNRRYHQVRLTDAGRHTAAELADAMRRRHERILASLSEAERRAVTVGLPALGRAMAAELDRTHRAQQQPD